MRLISWLMALSLSLCAFAEEHGGAGGEAKPVADHGEVDPDLEVRSAKQSSRDVKIPRALVTRLESEYRAYLTSNQLPPQETLKRKLIDVSVELRQRKPAALHEDVRINTPLGGGVIDLAEFVTPLRGAFQLLIKPRGENHASIDNLRVFFVSRAKERLIDGENYGSGCGRFMEVTKVFDKKMSSTGFELFTADQRYVSVLSGVFVMAAFTKDALQVGSVAFADSRFPELMCEN